MESATLHFVFVKHFNNLSYVSIFNAKDKGSHNTCTQTNTM